MNVISVCPLRVASLDWQTSRGMPVLTVIAKATYRLSPVTCSMAEEQEDPSEYETHWNYDSQRSLHSPSDFVPYKHRPEVTLVGQAFAPRGEPVARLVARLIVGIVDKAIAVHADRSFSQDGVLRHGPRFTRMALRYEKAAADPETWNPVGVSRSPDTLGVVTLPNLEAPDLNVTRPDDFIEPVSFGPIAADWPARRARLGRLAGLWSVSALRSGPLPEGIDPQYFLSAPRDQVLDELRPDERLVLENLHPEHPRLVTSLPGYEPRAFVERPGGVTDLPMICDTLWIDTDRGICTLTWRGQLTLDHPAEEGRVVVAMATLGRPLPWSAVEELASASGDNLDDTRPRPPGRSLERNTATHDPRAAVPSWPTWLASKDEPIAPGRSEPAKPPVRPVPADVWLADLASGTGTVDVAVSKQVIEAAIARAEADRARPAPAPPPPAPPLPSPPASSPEMLSPSWLRTPPPSSAPPLTPWAGTAPIVPTAPVPKPPLHADLPNGLRPPPSPPPPRVPSPVGLRQATERGAVAASNAAAASARETAPPRDRSSGASAAAPAREPAREHVDLIWFDPAALPRILAAMAVGEERGERPGPRWVKDGSAPREPQEARDRREILGVMSRGKPIEEPPGLDQIASSAYRDDGIFTAPLALVAGDLLFDFDELETLRAVLTVTAPFLGADKRLREVVGNATDALKAEGRLPGHIAAGLTRRIEEAFAQGQRTVAPDYLATSVERILLEGRHYPKKTLFGEPRLRALFAFPGAATPIPTYLPEALAARLPLFRRFRALAVVELRPQEDQYETHADALLVLALGRVLRRARGGD
jgi:hypothetical protein